MTYWSNNPARFAAHPLPGSVSSSGTAQTNVELQRQLDAINVLAYAFLKADVSGDVYFDNPAADLSSSDEQEFCR